jgi:hypothetical protein
MRCQHCKAPENEVCRGERLGIFCRKMDPTDPMHDPSFERILVRDDVVLAEQILPPEPPPSSGSGPCCGGNPYDYLIG